jgi:hypothetical protein
MSEIPIWGERPSALARRYAQRALRFNIDAWSGNQKHVDASAFATARRSMT